MLIHIVVQDDGVNESIQSAFFDAPKAYDRAIELNEWGYSTNRVESIQIEDASQQADSADKVCTDPDCNLKDIKDQCINPYAIDDCR